jgi:predicted amidophosphoribosyltransferase
LINRLPFATPFVYSTKGVSVVSKKSQELRDRIKKGDVQLFQQMAVHIEELVAQGKFPGFFGSDVTLVPVPGHAPLAPGAVSTAERIAQALAGRGLGAVSPLLKRGTRVTKSAWARGTDRPRAKQHFDSMMMEQSLIRPRRILLIDDVVTRGATFLGAALRIQSDIPDSEIGAFALARAITDREIEAIRDPVVGAIELDAGGESFRRP